MIYYLLVLHWLADFVFQTDKMAKGKSSSLKWLSLHIVEYITVLLVGSLIFGWKFAVYFSVLNGSAHFVIDFFTSKLSTHFHKKGAIHNFFVVIGFDQLLHTGCLIYTFNFLEQLK